MRYIYIAMMFLFFGCSSKTGYIYIPDPKVEVVKKTHKAISVKDVQLPYYLQDSKIAYIDGKKIEFLDRYFSSDATEFTTKRVIQLLKSSLASDEIYHYPWGKKSSYLLEIDIDKFISDEKRVYLKASWRLFDKDMKLKKSGKFYKTTLLKSKERVDAMRELFDTFIVDIAKRI